MSGGSVSFTAGALIATVLAIALALIAGIRSVAWTDAFQALIMIVTSVGVVWVVAQGLGGFDSLFSALERDYPEWLTVPGNGFFSFATFLGLTLPWFFFSISIPGEPAPVYAVLPGGDAPNASSLSRIRPHLYPGGHFVGLFGPRPIPGSGESGSGDSTLLSSPWFPRCSG